MIKNLLTHLDTVIKALRRNGAKFAIVGGIAVSFRTIPRNTNDLDLAVAVENDVEAEATVRSLMSCGYVVETVLEQDVARRMATVRLVSPDNKELLVDLLFASSGIEREVVSLASEVEITPGAMAPLATIPSLIAMKVLSANSGSRLKDVIDLQNLLAKATPEQLESSRELLVLITSRGYNRNKDLQKDLDGYIEQFTS